MASVPMKDWYIETFRLSSRGTVTYLRHRHHDRNNRDSICEVNIRDIWFCDHCLIEAPEEIGFCAELASCVRYPFGEPRE